MLPRSNACLSVIPGSQSVLRSWPSAVRIVIRGILPRVGLCSVSVKPALRLRRQLLLEHPTLLFIRSATRVLSRERGSSTPLLSCRVAARDGRAALDGSGLGRAAAGRGAPDAGPARIDPRASAQSAQRLELRLIAVQDSQSSRLSADFRRAAELAGAHQARLVLWVRAPQGRDELTLFLSEPSRGRVLARKLGSGASNTEGPSSSTLEAAALVLREALRAILAGEEVGIEEARAIAEHARTEPFPKAEAT